MAKCHLDQLLIFPAVRRVVSVSARTHHCVLYVAEAEATYSSYSALQPVQQFSEGKSLFGPEKLEIRTTKMFLLHNILVQHHSMGISFTECQPM